jgi:predicted XRE-type DNA-binding protein
VHFTFTVDVDVDRDQGKFATREELAAQIQEAIEQADPGSMEGENGGQYSTSQWEVNEQIEVKQPRKKRGAKKEEVES